MADYDGDDGGEPVSGGRRSNRHAIFGSASPFAQLEALDDALSKAAAEAAGGPSPLVTARPPSNPDGSGGVNEPGWFPAWVDGLRPARPAIAAGRAAPAEPQRALAAHGAALDPYAPFKGLPSAWDSHVYDDGGTFEGLTFAGQPHGPGVMVAGTDGGGGGIGGLAAGDTYEGEWYAGFAHGLGSARIGSTLYRGEWALGKRHGCGVQLDLAPFLDAVAGGADPGEAWAAHREEIEARAVEGTWVGDALLARPAPDTPGKPPPRVRLPGRRAGGGIASTRRRGRGGGAGSGGGDAPTIALCTRGELAATADEVDEVAARAQRFTYKPGGAVATLATQDETGLPAPVAQDPLHYPHGTKFLAPGPLGQCFALPDDPALRSAMADVAEAAGAVWDDYNLDYDIAPGSRLDEARGLARRDAAENLGGMRRAVALLGRLVRSESAKVRLEMEREEEAAGGGSGGGAGRGAARVREDDDVGADDLVAGGGGSGGGGGGGASRFGSLSLAALPGGARGGWWPGSRRA
jgi:hypothetical protein